MRIDYPQEDQIPQLQKLWKEAFGDTDAFIGAFFGTVFSPDRCRCVSEEGTVTAALYWLDCRCLDRPMAYLYAIATAKKYRGLGKCRLLMEDTHRLLAELGYAGCLLVPGERMLFRMYRGLGYETCSRIHEWSCKAADASIPLREISAGEYASLRRQYLPEGGVVQEAENLVLLKSQTRLYAGEDFLFCAAAEGGELLCPELLGNADAAPAILTALHAHSGTFRTPGDSKDFAMYHPLSDAMAPQYFGLAFD